uniref:BPTI/Kunitz inhibitor domain-containing protein n=1 Tax=Monopterus albus TaxID=43700 RepID=A0A3Q3J233_MONAL
MDNHILSHQNSFLSHYDASDPTEAEHMTYPYFCHLPQNEGDGEGFTFSFYYNATKDRCNPFIYKGRGGNANRFANEKQCIRNCSANAEKIYPMDALAKTGKRAFAKGIVGQLTFAS